MTKDFQHPRLAKGVDVGEFIDGRQYLIMNFIDGPGLDFILANTPTLPLLRARRIIAQLRDAIEHIHSEGIYHRDIKPANIMFESNAPSASLQLIDFGIASAPDFSSLSQDREIMGTVQYMSPEQLAGSALQPIQIDLWGLSVVAYECFSGGPPFDASSLGELFAAIHEGVFIPPSHRRDGLGNQFDAFFNRAFDEDIVRRFRSIDEWHEAFERAGRQGTFRGVIRLPRLHELHIDRPVAGKTPRSDGWVVHPSASRAVSARLPPTVDIAFPDLSYCMSTVA